MLRCMFDDRREDTFKEAHAAMYNSEHEFFPLFKNKDFREDPAGPDDDQQVVQDDMLKLDEACTLEDVQNRLEQEDPITMQHVRHVLSEKDAAPVHKPAEPAEPVDKSGRKICPLFLPSQRPKK